jgi:hypothetical protein
LTNTRKQTILTVSVIAILSILTAYLWYITINADYGELTRSIYLIFSYFFALILAAIALILNYKKKYLSSILNNLFGTYNTYIGIIGFLYLYYDDRNKFSFQMIIFLIPFVIGIFILQRAYIRKQ